MKKNPVKINVNNFKKGIKIEHMNNDLFFVSGGPMFEGTKTHSQSTSFKICPCCNAENEVVIWSFAGGGKICFGCGVLLGHHGAMIELKKMTKFDLINFILKDYKIKINKEKL